MIMRLKCARVLQRKLYYNLKVQISFLVLIGYGVVLDLLDSQCTVKLQELATH